jgi:adenylate cyclase
MKKTKTVLLIGILITFFFSFCAINKLLPLERFELLLYDLRYQIRGKTIPHQDVVIVAIDDKSIEKIGRWPWERSKMASLIDILHRMGAKVIFIDVIYSEPSKDDSILGEAIKKAGNVLLPIVFDFKEEKREVKDEILLQNAYPMVAEIGNFELFHPIAASNVLLPVKTFSSYAASLGHINMTADRDGVLRWEMMAVEYNGEYYPSLTLQAARIFLGLPMESMTLIASTGVRLGENVIPTDFWNRALIPYYGPEKTFPHLSIVDLVENKIDPSLVKDKIVLIGATAVGIYDLRVTPASPAMPGVEKHANVISSILHKNYLQKTKTITNLFVIIVSGLLLSFLTIRVRAILGAVLSFALISFTYFIGYYIFFKKGLWIDLSYTSMNILSIFLVTTTYRYATEERYAKRIRTMFSSYVTEKIVNELIKNPQLARLGGERREITVLFSDIRGFTTFSEENAPEVVVAMLNEYLGEMTHVIFQWDGTLDKFVGDEIVAFWGAPLPQKNHAELATKCALHMVRKLKELQKKWQSEGKTPLNSGIGINTGEVLVGNIGAEGKKMDYTVIGDHVNLGARVEGLTKKYNAHILITEFTLERIREAIQRGDLYKLMVKGLERVVVKGKEKPVTVYEISPTEEGRESIIIECEERDVVYMKEK